MPGGRAAEKDDLAVPALLCAAVMKAQEAGASRERFLRTITPVIIGFEESVRKANED